jgi:hypothetical protein
MVEELTVESRDIVVLCGSKRRYPFIFKKNWFKSWGFKKKKIICLIIPFPSDKD